MKPRSYSSEGIVMARRDFGEADRILVIYTKNYGRISFIAKGVRRPKSRKRGHIEVFNHLRFQAAAGHGLDIMTEAEVINDFKNIRSSLNKISLAYYVVEVVSKITHESEPNPELFEYLLNTLTKLSKVSKLKDLRIKFVSDLLVMMGYWPEDKKLVNPDDVLEEVSERQISSVRVGKRMLEN